VEKGEDEREKNTKKNEKEVAEGDIAQIFTSPASLCSRLPLATIAASRRATLIWNSSGVGLFHYPRGAHQG